MSECCCLKECADIAFQMMTTVMKQTEEKSEFKMNREENRLKSFKDWPLDNEYSKCTSKSLAKAGFVHIPSESEPDLVKCFVCLKQFEG